MGRRRKLTENTSKNFTTAEKEERQQAEERLSQFNQIPEEPPNWLDKAGKEEYRRIIDSLKQLPIADLDYNQVAAYCGFYSDFIKASRKLNREGAVIKSGNGSAKINPAFNVKKEAQTRMQSIASTLGMTIDSRLKILAPKKEELDADPLGDMLNGK